MAEKIADNLDLQNQSRIVNVPSPQNAGDAVPKSYVDGLASGQGSTTDFDASANPNYPSGNANDKWVVTVAGKVGGGSGKDVQVGDVITAKTNTVGGTQAAAGGDFFIVEGNKDKATEAVLGLVERATQAEVNAGTDDERYITPLKAETRMNAKLAAQTYNTTIGNGSDTSFQVTHGLNTTNPIVQVKETASGDIVRTGMAINNANNITVTFSQAPTTNFYTVIVQK